MAPRRWNALNASADRRSTSASPSPPSISTAASSSGSTWSAAAATSPSSPGGVETVCSRSLSVADLTKIRLAAAISKTTAAARFLPSGITSLPASLPNRSSSHVLPANAPTAARQNNSGNTRQETWRVSGRNNRPAWPASCRGRMRGNSSLNRMLPIPAPTRNTRASHFALASPTNAVPGHQPPITKPTPKRSPPTTWALQNVSSTKTASGPIQPRASR